MYLGLKMMRPEDAWKLTVYILEDTVRPIPCFSPGRVSVVKAKFESAFFWPNDDNKGYDSEDEIDLLELDGDAESSNSDGSVGDEADAMVEELSLISASDGAGHGTASGSSGAHEDGGPHL